MPKDLKYGRVTTEFGDIPDDEPVIVFRADRVAHLERLLAGERRQWTTALADHYLMSVECDPERKLDNPVCGCSRVFLGWHPSIGEARQAWISHVDQVVASAYVRQVEAHREVLVERVAELERLATVTSSADLAVEPAWSAWFTRD